MNEPAMKMIDLLEIAADRSRDTISGRRTGEAARDRYDLNSPLEPEEILRIMVPQHVRVITPSFFVGFLARAVSNMGSPSEARMRVRLENASSTTKLNLAHALTSLLTTDSPFSALQNKPTRKRLFG